MGETTLSKNDVQIITKKIRANSANRYCIPIPDCSCRKSNQEKSVDFTLWIGTKDGLDFCPFKFLTVKSEMQVAKMPLEWIGEAANFYCFSDPF